MNATHLAGIPGDFALGAGFFISGCGKESEPLRLSPDGKSLRGELICDKFGLGGFRCAEDSWHYVTFELTSRGIGTALEVETWFQIVNCEISRDPGDIGLVAVLADAYVEDPHILQPTTDDSQ